MNAELTELERVKMENFALRFHVSQQQMTQVQNDRAAFIQQMTAARPGFYWKDPEGTFVPVPVPEPAVEDNVEEAPQLERVK